MLIYCCECKKEIEARLTDGKEIYSHRDDLYDLPFWKCDDCKNYVGCHHKTKDKTKPLGNIPNTEIRGARKYIHALLDPMWQNEGNKFHARGSIYKWLSEQLDYKYHTAEIRTIKEARNIYALLIKYKKNNDQKHRTNSI